MIVEKQIDTNEIVKLFGINSTIFKNFSVFFKKIGESQKSNYDNNFIKWKEKFLKIYDQECTQELFSRHLYYVTILELLLISKITHIKKYEIKELYDIYITNSIESISNIKEFHFYKWLKVNQKLFKDIYKEVKDFSYKIGDLFHSLYQHLFFLSARHRIGEFYTPSNLVKKMVKDSYVFGQKVLDPSCGSGNFILEIIIKILNSKESDQSKLKAIRNIYGFDINPLATLTVKTNLSLLFYENFPDSDNKNTYINIFLIDSLFENEEKNIDKKIKNLYNSFDLIIGNPPWLTYKDLNDKSYQNKIRHLAESLGIKPDSQYITHIELATIFFYNIPQRFLKLNCTIFFVMPQSVLNGDHCTKFRAFTYFNDLEIWDFPKKYFFNVNHICLKAKYIGDQDPIIGNKYPIKSKIFDNELKLKKKTNYSTLKISHNGALLILPKEELRYLQNITYSDYKEKFSQGATLVPRTLVFFQIIDTTDNHYIISSDKDIQSRSKNEWIYSFKNIEIEKEFRFITFLNLDLVPFVLKKKRNAFIPIKKDDFTFDLEYLKKFPKAFEFYKEINKIYKLKKKKTSRINDLFSNLNYWNKLLKQGDYKLYTVVYNASGSNIKSAVIKQYEEKIIIGSENYYYSTDSKYEAYYLSAILNSRHLNRYINVIKSSRHIHKRPFHFPIPIYSENNENHYKLAKKGIKYTTYVGDLLLNNPDITTNKIRTVLNENFNQLDNLTKKIVFK